MGLPTAEKLKQPSLSEVAQELVGARSSLTPRGFDLQSPLHYCFRYVRCSAY